MVLKDINFTKFGDRGYHYTADPSKEYMYFIQFANRNADIKIYYIINNKKYFFKQIQSNNDEDGIIITSKDLLPNDDDMTLAAIAQAIYHDNLLSIDINTSHRVVKCQVLYEDKIPQ